LSNLTKILIVLLTISAIFLCGIVVTYVANAENYRQKYAKLNSDLDVAKKAADALKGQLNEKIQQKDDLEKTLSNQVASMKTKADELQANLSNVEREKAELLERVNNWASITKDFSETTEKQTQTLNTALEEVRELKAEQIKISKELEQTSSTLVEKMAMMESAEADRRRLTEEKKEVEDRLDKLLRAGGKVVAAEAPVTQEKDAASAVQPAVVPIALKCLVSEIDAKNSMATISIGNADGVKEGMKFHVTRGDEFICDILIIEVDTEKSVGVLELVQQLPKVGDNASTNL
jgi:DNA repair exonuclease SbcCD ATPase subunit